MLLSLFAHLCFKVRPCSSCSESHILCFKVAPCFSYSESHMLSPSYTSGNFSLQSQMHTYLVFILSFHTLTTLSAFVAWQSLLLTLISINGHLHSPLIHLVDVRLSSPFCLLHNHHSIPPIVLCPWLMLMYCVEKV